MNTPDIRFHAQIDSLKKQDWNEKKAAMKAAGEAFKAAKAEAKQLLKQHEAAMLAKYSKTFGVKQITETIRDMAKNQPVKFIGFVAVYLKEVN